MIIIIFLLCALCALLVYLYLNQTNESFAINEITYTDKNIIHELYKILYGIDKIFIKAGITYFITNGTLLGCVRHKGLIPWCDKIDINIFDYDEDKLNDLTQKLKSYGYDFKKTSYGYAISIPNIKNKLNIHILTIEDYNIKPEKNIPKNKYDANSNKFFYLSEIYPLRKYKFGSFIVFGPNKSEYFLKRCYTNWDKTITKGSKQVNITPNTSLGPALPFYPFI